MSKGRYTGDEYALALMDKDGALPEFLIWFESEAEAISELMTVKDRLAYIFKILHYRETRQ